VRTAKAGDRRLGAALGAALIVPKVVERLGCNPFGAGRNYNRCLARNAIETGRNPRRFAIAKEKKTARELADMLAARIGVDGIQIAVHKSPMYGWDANIITVPSQAINAHAMLQQIVAELRERYDLKE
jgi:hypothetical protein